MPFIDLNNQNQNNSTSTPPPVPTASTGSVQPVNAQPADSSAYTQISTDPSTGIREIKGADFAEPAVQLTNQLNQANLEAQSQPQPQPQMAEAQQMPTQSAPQAMTLEQQSAGGMMQNQVVAETPAPAPAVMPQPQITNAMPEPVMQDALPQITQQNPVAQQAPTLQEQQSVSVVTEPETELIVGTSGQQSAQPIAESQPQIMESKEDALPELPVQETQPQSQYDPLDKSLPVLEPQKVDTGMTLSVEPSEVNKLKMAEEVGELKTQEEQIELESKNYGLDELLIQTVQLGASDLHLTSGYRAMARIDGKLEMIKSQELSHDLIYKMMENVTAPMKHIDLKTEKDIDLSYELPDKSARFRVNIGYQRGTINATFRLIPKHIRTPEELRLPAVVKEFTKYKQGLVLVTGPTGSGKSTTLASLINTINLTEPSHIITVEDPIEYTYPRGRALVDQRAVHIDTTSWSMALRAALRQDPDVVLIGEMRDVETMEAALQVAETGHLVFSTLHTNTAAQTIDRIIDAFPENKQSQVRTQLSSTLMAVQSQRLLPVAGGGRRLVAEVMVVTAGIRNAIREGKVFQIDNMIQTGAELGMVTMEKSLAQLVREGQISTEMAQRYANKPEDVLSLLGRK